MYRTFELKRYYVVGVNNNEELVRRDDIITDSFKKITYENIGFYPALIRFRENIEFKIDFTDEEFRTISHVMEKNAPAHVTKTFSGFTYKARVYDEKSEEITERDGYRPGSFDDKTTLRMKKEFAEDGLILLKLTEIEPVSELRGIKVTDFIEWARQNNKLG